MDKKILVISIFAAVLMALLPISSVVGVDVVKSNAEKGSVASPLFAFRRHSANNENIQKINTNYIGKGNLLNLFLLRQSSFQRMINRAIKLIETRPDVLNVIIDRIETNPEIVNILSEKQISIDDVKNQVTLIKNDPSLLRQMIDEGTMSSPGDGSQPLGLSTSSAIGCFIVLIALIPLALVLTMLIATITIITCLNIGGCFETIFENIMEGMISGLTPPDY